MTSGASAETRVLANPTKAGIRFIVRMKTDGGGTITVSAANGLDVALSGYANFADAGDSLSLISVSLTATTYRWDTLVTTGAAVATGSSTATATGTGTSTATSTATPSATATSSSTQSISGSDTASGTFSASVSATSTSTASSTPTSTSTSTSTGTATSTATQ